MCVGLRNLEWRRSREYSHYDMVEFKLGRDLSAHLCCWLLCGCEEREKKERKKKEKRERKRNEKERKNEKTLKTKKLSNNCAK